MNRVAVLGWICGFGFLQLLMFVVLLLNRCCFGMGLAVLVWVGVCFACGLVVFTWLLSVVVVMVVCPVNSVVLIYCYW